jgi:collagenase-like PrtC family protease
MPALPEILAPAGEAACLSAAVAGGADAVYLGLRHFNARGRAANFKRHDLAGHVAYCHAHGLKVYVVLNTLVHDDELPKALDLAHAAYLAGVDAAIIQDWGLWQAMAQEVPGLPRHASTQMTVYRPDQIHHLAAFGAERSILARELSLAEIAACVETGRECGVEIEVFVHGALCYAVSGQCLISNFSGCRSANRGTCAQNCRFVYDDGRQADTHLSMRDFSLLERVGALADIGVASLKIEGRLKGPEYVFTVAKAYHEALLAWSAQQPVPQATLQSVNDVFSRGFTADPLNGVYSSSSRLSRTAGATGRVAGQILHLDRRQGEATLALAQAPQVGDGFRMRIDNFDDGFLVQAVRGQQRHAGGQAAWQCRVKVARRGPPVQQPLDVVRNRRAGIERDLQSALAALPTWRGGDGGVLVSVQAEGGVGRPLRLIWHVRDGRKVVVCSEDALSVAQQQGLEEVQLRKAIGSLAGSGMVLDTCTVADALHECFVPQRDLKRLRREAIDALHQQPVPQPTWPYPPAERGLSTRATSFFVVVADVAIALALQAVEPDAHCIVVRPPDAGVSVPDRGCYLMGNAFVPAPAALPAGWGYCAADLATAAHLAAQGVNVIAGPTCNVFNTSSITMLWQAGVTALTMSYECSSREVARIMSRLAEPEMGQVVVPVHGRLPAMLTRQDHGLAVGEQRDLQASNNEGGLPYTLERLDASTTMLWEGRRLAAPKEAQALAGVVDGWWLDLGDLTADAVLAVVRAYRGLRDGELTPDDVLGALEPFGGQGYFPGHLRRGSRELDRLKSMAPDWSALQ